MARRTIVACRRSSACTIRKTESAIRKAFARRADIVGAHEPHHRRIPLSECPPAITPSVVRAKDPLPAI
jgi:hypothetical protein